MLDILQTQLSMSHKKTWALIESGDMLAYSEGSIFYVQGIEISDDDGITTFNVRCVVEPEHTSWIQGTEGVIAVNRFWILSDELMITKGQ